MNVNVSIENPGYPQSWDMMIEEPLNNEFWIEKVGSFQMIDIYYYQLYSNFRLKDRNNVFNCCKL